MTPLLNDRAIRVVDLIQWRFSSLDADLDDYVDIPCTFWKKAIAEHYERVMQPLVNAGIVQRLNCYSTLLNQCKKYRINPEYMDDTRKVIWYNHEQGKRKKDNSQVCKDTRRILRKLILDKRAAKKYIEIACSKVEIEKRLLFDEAVNGGKNLSVLIKNNSREGFRKFFMSKEKALNYAKGTNRNLIEDGQKVVIDFKEAYIARKQRHVEFSYCLHIEKFYNGEYYANRNDTNYRLDSNITTIPSKLLSFFSLEGEPLVGLDLSNSQFVVMAKLLEEGN